MRPGLKTIATLAVGTPLLAYVVYALIVPPEWARRRDPAQVQGPTAAELHESLPLNGTFTTAGRICFEDLTLSFNYPSFWEYGELVCSSRQARISTSSKLEQAGAC